jgi:hypothetical protein
MAVVGQPGGRIDVFGLGLDFGVFTNVWDGAKWSGWIALGGRWISTPRVLLHPGGVFTIYMMGRESALWVRKFDGKQWIEWRKIEAVLYGGEIFALKHPSGGSLIFGIGDNSAVCALVDS